MDNKFDWLRTGIRFAVTGLVEIFMSAVTKSVMGEVEGSKLAKMGAKAGGALVGMYVGDKVTTYICDGIDEVVDAVGSYEEKTDISGEEAED